MIVHTEVPDHIDSSTYPKDGENNEQVEDLNEWPPVYNPDDEPMNEQTEIKKPAELPISNKDDKATDGIDFKDVELPIYPTNEGVYKQGNSRLELSDDSMEAGLVSSRNVFTSREYHESGKTPVTKSKSGTRFVVVGIGLLMITIILFSAYLTRVNSKQTDNTIALNQTIDVPGNKTNEIPCLTRECIKIAADLLNTLDRTFNPCDNFYEYVCGGWIENHPTFKDGVESPSRTIGLKNKFLLKQILDQSETKMKSKSEKKAKMYYDSCKNYIHKGIDVNGTKAVLAKIGNWMLENSTTTNWHYQTMMEKILMEIDNVPVFFKWSIVRYPKNNTQRIIQIGPGGCNLPLNHYLYKDHPGIEKKFRPHIQAVLVEFFDNNTVGIEEIINGVIEFETRLAEIIASSESESTETTTLSSLNVEAPFINWTRYFENVYGLVGEKIDPRIIVVNTSPEYFRKLNELINSYKNTIKGDRAINNYLMLRSLNFLPPDSPNPAITDERETKQVETGKETTEGDDCINEIDFYMQFATAAILARENGDKSIHSLVDEMVNATKNVFIQELENLDWIDPKTKTTITKKTKAMKFSISHPDFVNHPEQLDKYYKDLSFQDNDYFVNNLRAKQFFLKKHLINDDIGRTWFKGLSTVQVSYIPDQNEVVIPVGALQKPIIDIDKPKSMNYGRFGRVIGHEIIHGFDDSSREYDSQGRQKQGWWTDTITEELDKRSQCFVNQYNGYVVEGEPVNGMETLGENIADNGGVKIAYRAYLNSPEFQTPPWRLPMTGLQFTHEQLFFVSYAQSYCNSKGRQAHHESVLHDVHCPDEYRVVGSLSNLKEFAKAFNCSKDARMNPKTKCKLW